MNYKISITKKKYNVNMHTNINKYILAHPFLSTYSKLSSQLRFVDRRNHPKKQKNFLAVFPFKE